MVICEFLGIQYIEIGYNAIADSDALIVYFAKIWYNYTQRIMILLRNYVI